MKSRISIRSLAAVFGLPGRAAMARPAPVNVQPSWKSPIRRAWLATLARKDRHRLTKSTAAALIALAIGGITPAYAQVVLTEVPMQGSMLMPEVFYHADTDTVTVDLSTIAADPTAPAQLTPLLVSNPTNRFSAADPWFDCLDPSRQGLAFSRRYGFTPAEGTDTLPLNRQLWIRKLSGSPDLGFYDYRNNQKRWTPLFGTAGVSNAAYWNGRMWHVGVTAPPGTNTYEATFEVFVLSTETGLEITGSGSGPFVLHWTDVPDGRPTLSIAVQPPGQFRLAWPESATNWLPVCSASLNGAAWSDITNEPVLVDGLRTLFLNRSEPPLFFQMRLKP